MMAATAKTLVSGAARRAELAAFLASQAEPQSIKQIAEAMGWAESATAYTARIAAESGLIKSRKQEFSNKLLYSIGNGEGNGADEASEVSGGELSVIQPKGAAKKGRIVAAREVELVVAGVLVILGRNPVSGRLRILLEEM